MQAFHTQAPFVSREVRARGLDLAQQRPKLRLAMLHVVARPTDMSRFATVAALRAFSGPRTYLALFAVIFDRARPRWADRAGG